MAPFPDAANILFWPAMIRTRLPMSKLSTLARQRGFALVMVLWAAVVLALIAGGVARLSRADLNLSRNLIESTQAELAADGALWTAIYMIVNGDPADWHTDGTVYAWRFGDAEVRVRVRDEMGRIDINAASPELLAALFVAAGVGPEEATGLADAVEEYRNQDVKYPDDPGDPRNSGIVRRRRGPDPTFALTDELAQVPGMPRALPGRIADAITVYTAIASPRPGAASPLALAAIEGREFVEPGDVEDVSETVETLALGNRPAVLSEPAEPAEAARGSPRVLHIEAEAVSAGGSYFAREAVIALDRRETLGYRLRLWRRGTRVLFPVPEEAR